MGTENPAVRFLQTSVGGLHAYMDEQIQFLWSRVRRDVLARLDLSCELFRDEVGTKLNRLRDPQMETFWAVVGEVGVGKFLSKSCGGETIRAPRKKRYGRKRDK